jgi:hypothetical protein
MTSSEIILHIAFGSDLLRSEVRPHNEELITFASAENWEGKATVCFLFI